METSELIEKMPDSLIEEITGKDAAIRDASEAIRNLAKIEGCDKYKAASLALEAIDSI